MELYSYNIGDGKNTTTPMQYFQGIMDLVVNHILILEVNEVRKQAIIMIGDVFSLSQYLYVCVFGLRGRVLGFMNDW